MGFLSANLIGEICLFLILCLNFFFFVEKIVLRQFAAKTFPYSVVFTALGGGRLAIELRLTFNATFR